MEGQWRDNVSEGERMQLITELVVELTRVSGETDTHKVWSSVAKFELMLWSNSPDRTAYTTKMQRKIANLKKKATKTSPPQPSVSPAQQLQAPLTQAPPRMQTWEQLQRFSEIQSTPVGEQSQAQQWLERLERQIQVQLQQFRQQQIREMTQLRQQQLLEHEQLAQQHLQEATFAPEVHRQRAHQLEQEHEAARASLEQLHDKKCAMFRGKQQTYMDQKRQLLLSVVDSALDETLAGDFDSLGLQGQH